MPSRIAGLQAFLLWRSEQKEGEPKPRKVPYYANGRRRSGTQGSPEDRARLVTLERANEICQRGGYDGIGIAMLPEHDLVGFDWDNCVNADGTIHAAVLEASRDTYAEYSPSGKGVHAFFEVEGDLPDRKTKADEEHSYGTETFRNKGFLTITGKVIEECALVGDHDTVARYTPTAKRHYELRFGVSEPKGQTQRDQSIVGMGAKLLWRLLLRIDPDMIHNEWVKVLMAIHHESGGEQWGLDLADKWSQLGDKYLNRAEIERKWAGFGKTSGDVVTARWLKSMAAANDDDFEDLTAAPSGVITLRPIADIVAEKREPLWLLLDILEQAVIALIAGPRNTFKSFIALYWAILAALQGYGVVILSGEGAGLDRRVDGCMRTHAPDFDLSALPIVAYERALALNSAKVVAELAAAIRTLPWVPKLILVDTFSKFSPGLDENDNPQVAEFLTRLGMALRDEFGCTLLLVAHSGHSDPGRPRGASSLMANPDAEYIVKRDPLSMFATVTRERFKDSPSLPPLTYEAVVVDLGRVDSRGRQVSSLAMRLTDAADAPRLPREPDGKNQRLVWGVVQEQIDLDHGTATVEDIVAEAANRMTKPDGRDTRRQRAKEALESLRATGFVAILNDEVALT